ncbi:hypothetical protein K502DRAFT_62247 [Neoconidiobolus thromboides FSU 785]|nr:hypothetical protein K502DRAFT_62247 [Neoconidiobolus thromboides FSU 785]
MTLSNCTFEQVSKLQLNNKIHEDTLSLNYDTNDTTTNNDGNDVNSEIIKEAIIIRVDLLIPCIKEMVDFVNLNIRMEWTEIFLGLLQNAVLIGEENKEEFEFMLDFFSYYMNLIPKENKSELFSVLRKNYPKLTKTAINDPRIKRLFPFEAKSNYSSDIKNNTTDENEFVPWEWDNNLIKDGDNEIITKFNPIRLYHPNILATGPQINDTSPLITANNFKVVNHSNSPFTINNSPFTTYDSPFTINNTRKLMKPRVAASPIGSIGITQSPLAALQSSLSQLAMSHSNKSNKDQANNKNEIKKSKE